MSEDTNLMLTTPVVGALDRPKSIAIGDRAGTEDIGIDDIRLPRLGIAQGLSDQINPESSAYVDGLKLFDMFNDLTGEVHGRGPITFVPVRRDVRYIEFDPENRGVPLDMDVPANDSRTQWTKDAAGKGVAPKALRFVEFVVLILSPGRLPEPIVISIKETNKFNRRAAEQLTAFIVYRQAPIYAGLYTVASKSEKNDKGTFGVYVMKNAGWIPKDTPGGAALYEHCKLFSESLANKTIVVTREPGDEAAGAEEGDAGGNAAGGTSFDTSKM